MPVTDRVFKIHSNPLLNDLSLLSVALIFLLYRRLTLSQVARILRKAPSTVHYIVSKLVKMGLVEQTYVVDKKSGVLVRVYMLTQRGRKLTLQVLRVLEDITRLIERRLDEHYLPRLNSHIL